MAISYEQAKKGIPINQAFEQKANINPALVKGTAQYYNTITMNPDGSFKATHTDNKSNSIPWTPILIGLGVVGLFLIMK